MSTFCFNFSGHFIATINVEKQITKRECALFLHNGSKLGRPIFDQNCASRGVFATLLFFAIAISQTGECPLCPMGNNCQTSIRFTVAQNLGPPDAVDIKRLLQCTKIALFSSSFAMKLYKYAKLCCW